MNNLSTPAGADLVSRIGALETNVMAAAFGDAMLETLSGLGSPTSLGGTCHRIDDGALEASIGIHAGPMPTGLMACGPDHQ